MAPMCADVLAGRAVLIGADALDQDRHATPFDKLSEDSAGAPGVLLHYFALSALADPALRIRELDHSAWKLCLLALLLSLAAIRYIRWYNPIVPLLVIAGYYFAGVAALCWLRLYLPWQPVLLTMLAAYPLLCLVAASARAHEVKRLCEL
jgi:CHASE2 domain-containing sensor protein